MPGRRWTAWLLDLLLFIVLCLAAFPVRWGETAGDLWYDEADYARAAARGFEANRWDHPESVEEPEKLVRLRHYHPPLIAQVLAGALRWGPEERTLRAPFVLAGCLTVGMLYLCGLASFRRRDATTRETRPLRSAAFAVGVILLVTPAHIRASSHAIPWAWITLWLVCLLWTYLQYAETQRPAWLAASGAVLGALFVTSEYLFPTLVMAAASLAVLLWTGRDRRPDYRAIAGHLALGAGCFLLVTAIFWPVGLSGGAVKMLRHYVEMADTSAFPVVIEGQRYERAPKWAYLYWYWTEFLPFFVLYAAGAGAFLWLVLRRRVTPGTVLVGLFTAAILAVAHRAHIIGPEYLVHALPFLTLLGGIPLAGLAARKPLHSLPVLTACCWILGAAPEVEPMNGMEPRSQVPRWPAAARFLAERWQPGNRILASQFAVSARWYLLHHAGVAASEEEIRMLPASGASDELLDDLLRGRYRWVVVGNTFSDWTDVDNRIRMVIQRWPVVFRSDEQNLGLSRLQIYERPRGVSARKPLPAPWLPEVPADWPEAWYPWYPW